MYDLPRILTPVFKLRFACLGFRKLREVYLTSRTKRKSVNHPHFAPNYGDIGTLLSSVGVQGRCRMGNSLNPLGFIVRSVEMAASRVKLSNGGVSNFPQLGDWPTR